MTCDKFYHRKLIRDKIPQAIEASGGEYETRVLGEEEYRKELQKKLIEEAKELTESDKENVLNEMADVLELLKSIASLYEIDFTQVEKKQTDKKAERGGFEKKLFLIWSSNQSGK